MSDKENLFSEFINDMDEIHLDKLREAVERRLGEKAAQEHQAKLADLETRLANVDKLPYTIRTNQAIALRRQIAQLRNTSK